MAEDITKSEKSIPKKSIWYLWACGGCGCLVIIIIIILFMFRLFTGFSSSDLSGNKQGSTSQDEEDKEMTKTELINYFIAETTVWPGVEKPMKVIKWKKDIVTVSIEDTPPEGGAKTVDEFIEKFNRNSSTAKLKRISNGGDIKIYFEKPTNGAAGKAGPSSGADYIIDLGYVELSEEATLFEKSLDQIFAHEMFHALGFYGHYKGDECRLMSPTTCGSHFTINEERLIKMLYGTEIPEGSDANDVRTYFQNWTPQ